MHRGDAAQLRAGVDSRLASGSANTSSGGLRGVHTWVELTLSENARYLSDQTWDDPFIPLWDGAYDVDKQRTEMYDRTSRYDGQIVDSWRRRRHQREKGLPIGRPFLFGLGLRTPFRGCPAMVSLCGRLGGQKGLWERCGRT